MTFRALVYFFFFAPCDAVLPQLLWGSHGQLRLEMEVGCPSNVSAKHLAASSLMGQQHEMLALIISHWNESRVCVREEGCGLHASSLSTPPSHLHISNQFKQPLMKNI